MMPPRLSKTTLLAHIVLSVGSMGAVAAFLTLAVIGLSSREPENIRAAYVVMDLVTRIVIVPLILAALLSGIVQSLGTAWGLVRHYWVLAKLLLTAFTVGVLLLQLGPIAMLAALAAESSLSDAMAWQARLSLVVHASGGLLVLFLATTLSVFKPRGMTPCGRRRHELGVGRSTPS
jgi:hypothetical protein